MTASKSYLVATMIASKSYLYSTCWKATQSRKRTIKLSSFSTESTEAGWHISRRLYNKGNGTYWRKWIPPRLQRRNVNDTLVFGLNSDKVRKDAIAPGNKLTFQQRLTKAKTEESTTAQMKAMTQGSSEIKIKKRTLCVAARGIRVDFQDHRAPQNTHTRPRNNNNSEIK